MVSHEEKYISNGILCVIFGSIVTVVGLGGYYPPWPSASVDNTLLNLQNSPYPTQPHSIIALLFILFSLLKLVNLLAAISLFVKITQPRPQVFSVNGSIICTRLHF